MAYEHITGRMQVVMKEETTYGTDASPVVGTDDIYFETFEWDLTPDMKQRVGMSEEAPGFRPSPQAYHLTWSGTKDMAMKTITAPVSSADYPEFDAALIAAGFTRTLDDTDTSITYALVADGAAGVTIKVFEADAQAPGSRDVNRATLLGARCDGNITWSEGTDVMLALTGGFAIPGTVANTVAETTQTQGSLFQSDKQFTGKGMVNRIVNLGDDSVYGGGTIASPSNAALVIGGQINFNNGTVEHTATHASGGIGRVYHNHNAPKTAQITVEQVGLNDFDPYTLRDTCQPLEVSLLFAQPGSPGNTMQILFYAVITGITRGGDIGRKTWALDLQLVYVQDVGDDDPEAGLSPSQTPTNTGSQGLLLVPTAALPPALLYIQLATA